MELKQLAQFKKIAECRTLSEAAAQLHISQPALSTMLKKLEAELGVALFQRTRNKITLNEAGELALLHAKQVLAQADKMREELAAFGQRHKTFAVGFCDPGPMWYCAPKFSLLFADLVLQPQCYGPGQNETALLQSGRFDLLVTPHPISHDALVCRHFIREQLLLSVPETAAVSAQAQVSLRQHPVDKLALFLVDGAFSRQTLPLFQEIGANTAIHRYEDYFMYQQTVQNQPIATTTTRIVRHYRNDGSGRALVPISDSEAAIDYHVAYLQEKAPQIQPLLEWIAMCAADFQEPQPKRA